MSRVGYSFVAGTPGENKAQNFRNFLASNLTTWTVGPVYAFNSGTVERDYFTLTSTLNGSEILFNMPNGSVADLDNGILNPFEFGNSSVSNFTDQTISLLCAPDGGFEARLVLGEDPQSNADVFPSRLSRASPMQYWFEGNAGSVTFYAIEDTTEAAFFLYSGYTTSNLGYAYWGYSENYLVFDLAPNDATLNFDTDSVVQMQPTNSALATPRPVFETFQWWFYPGMTPEYLDRVGLDYSDPGYIQDLTSTQLFNPVNGSFASARVISELSFSDAIQELDYGGYVGQLNPAIHRQFGTIDPGYRKKFFTGTGETFIHVYAGQLTPWAANLNEPSS